MEANDIARHVAALVEVLADLVAERVAVRLLEQNSKSTSARSLLSKQALATTLDVSTTTVDRLVKEARIPFLTVGDVKRFDLFEVREALRIKSSPAAPPTEADLDALVRYGRRRPRKTS